MDISKHTCEGPPTLTKNYEYSWQLEKDMKVTFLWFVGHDELDELMQVKERRRHQKSL